MITRSNNESEKSVILKLDNSMEDIQFVKHCWSIESEGWKVGVGEGNLGASLGQDVMMCFCLTDILGKISLYCWGQS